MSEFQDYLDIALPKVEFNTEKELKCLADGMGKRLVIDFVKKDYFMGI